MPCKQKVNLDMNMLQSAAGNSGKTEPALTDQDEGCFSSLCFVLFWSFVRRSVLYFIVLEDKKKVIQI